MAVNFNGAGAVVSARNAGIDITGDITILCWMKRASTGSFSAFMAKTDVSTVWDYEFYVSVANILEFYSDATTPQSVTGPTVNDTLWHRVGVRRSGTAVDFFVDGTKTAASGAMTGSFNNSNQSLYIGYDGTFSTHHQARTLLYNVALTDNEVDAALLGVPVRLVNRTRAFELFGVSSPEPDESALPAHGTVTSVLQADHPTRISAEWKAPMPKAWQGLSTAVVGSLIPMVQAYYRRRRVA